MAGKRGAQSDARWLWPEFARIIDEAQPAIVVAENVLGLRTAGLRIVLADLAARRFDVEWACLGAGDIGAPHRRRRIFIVATHPDRALVREQPGWLGRAFGAAREAVDRSYREGLDAADADGSEQRRDVPPGQPEAIGGAIGGDAPNADSLRRLEQAWRVAEQRGWARECGWSLGQDPRVDDGLPGRLERRRKALGNAVSPVVSKVVGAAIREVVEWRKAA